MWKMTQGLLARRQSVMKTTGIVLKPAHLRLTLAGPYGTKVVEVGSPNSVSEQR